MRCANCGGTIHINEPCEDCGIAYDEMLEAISHPEMRRLFRRIEDLQENHKSVEVEASMMACELLNSSLILPAKINDDSFGFIHLPADRKNSFIVLCTDMDEFRHFEEMDLTPLTNSWDRFLELLEKNDGVAINIFDVACFIDKNFMRRFFADKLNTD